MANPTLLKTPIASGGDKNTIPETTGSTTGLLSQEKGWQQINSLPINAGGIAPSRLDFNGVFNLLSNILFYAQKGWQWEFDETQNYFAGCTVKDTADGKTYVCIADVNASTTHPSSDTVHWKLSDLATKDDLANYLPLAGGSMTGNLINKVDNSALEIVGAIDDTKGGAIKLFGKDYGNVYAGAVRIYTSDSNGNNKFLDIMPSGSLTWDGHNVLTDANGGYLPLSGGALTGSTIKRSVDGSGLILAGATSQSNGASVQLNGKARNDGYAGWFYAEANDGTNAVDLVGRPNGTLLWNNNDLSDASIVAKSLGGANGYIKYASGLIMQWGQSSNVTRWDFPITFPTAVIGVYAGINYTGEQSGYNAVKTLTTSYLEPSLQSPVVTTYWLVLGY